MDVENSVTFDPGLDYGATFRFPVTWSYLTATPDPTQTNTAPPASPSRSAKPAPVRTLEVIDLPVKALPVKDLPVKDPPPAAAPMPTILDIRVEAPVELKADPKVEAPVAAKVEAKTEVKIDPLPPAPPRAVALVPANQPAATPKPQQDTSGPEAKWEMVIPKMARPLAARMPRALQQAMQPAAQPVAATPTEISFYAGSEASF